MFYPNPEIPQLKQARSYVHPNAQVILPEIPEIQVVVALKIVNLHSAGNDPAQVVHDGRKLPDEVFVAAEPEIEDVANEEQMGRLDPGPHVLEKTEQDLSFRLIHVLQMDVREEIGFRSHVHCIAWSKSLWKSLRDPVGGFCSWSYPPIEPQYGGKPLAVDQSERRGPHDPGHTTAFFSCIRGD